MWTGRSEWRDRGAQRPAAGRPRLLGAVLPVGALAGLALLVAVVSCTTGPGRPAVTAAPGTDRADLSSDSTAKLLRGRPFHQDARALDLEGQKTFAAGAEVFQHPITVTPPGGERAPFSPRPGQAPAPDATGPLFVETTCMTCHVDGTGAPVGSPGPGLVVKVAAAAGAATGQAHPTLGHQLSTDAVPGAAPEGTATIRWEELSGRYADGTAYTLRRPLATVGGSLVQQGGAAAVSLRVAPPLLGLGFLESIPPASLARAADPDDADHDGVSGRVPRGRFGWKGAQPTVRSQTVSALAHDMGVTTGESPDPCEDRPVDCDPSAPGMSSSPGRPELLGQPFDDLIVYTEAIAVPRARDLTAPAARRGAEAFTAFGCAACHTPTQRTGPTRSTTDTSGIFSDRTVHPYTDLLLHDMGAGLDDGVGEPGARPAEWRTAALWGLGLRDEVYGAGRYLHDGRAATIPEAILWHGGEAAAARDDFLATDASTRDDLVAFLRSL